MNIGIFFKHERSGGGIYQYFLTILECFKNLNTQDHFFLFYCHEPESLSEFRKAGIKTIKLTTEENLSAHSVSGDDQIPRYSANYNGKQVYFKTKPFTKELQIASANHKIDLMLYTNAERESFESGIPYIMSLLDWTHKTHPEFKEFSADGIYEQREYIITNGLRNACLVLADSETGKEEIINYYGADPEKIEVLPFIPPPYLYADTPKNLANKLKLKYQLPDKFIFYPAQFWPHKNHENIVKALYLVKKNRGKEITAVFIGSTQNRWSSFEKVMNLAKDLKIENQIMYLGYLDSKYMYPLYKLATALVMPTFPGPTNIPVLEAFAIGCPVITSDIKALREQVGKAGILVDPKSAEQIERAIYQIWTDEILRKTLTKRGREKICKWTRDDFCNRLEAIINMCCKRLKSQRQADMESLNGK